MGIIGKTKSLIGDIKNTWYRIAEVERKLRGFYSQLDAIYLALEYLRKDVNELKDKNKKDGTEIYNNKKEPRKSGGGKARKAGGVRGGDIQG